MHLHSSVMECPEHGDAVHTPRLVQEEVSRAPALHYCCVHGCVDVTLHGMTCCKCGNGTCGKLLHTDDTWIRIHLEKVLAFEEEQGRVADFPIIPDAEFLPQ